MVSTKVERGSSTGGSRRLPQTSARGSLRASQALWGIDWATWLPRRITADGIELHASDIARALRFTAQNDSDVFEQGPHEHFFQEPFDGTKLHYCRTSDVFEWRHDERTIGVLIAAPADWSTYYCVRPVF